MTCKVFSVLLLSCALCSGQSTPDTSLQSSPMSIETGTTTQLTPTCPEEETSPQSCQAAPTMNRGQAVTRSKNSDANKTKSSEDADAAAPQLTTKIGPRIVRSDFAKFVEDAVGRPLAVYGRQLFDEAPSTFAPMDRIPVPADYAIGPGDELLIRVWGKIDLDTTVTVDRNGQISIPKVGTLNVAGLRYEQLGGYLRTSIGTIYKGFELNVTMGRLRSIQILY